MGREYRVRLLTKEGDNETLKTLAKVYRKAYNAGIEAQFEHLTYSKDYMNQLIPAEEVAKLMKDSGVMFPKVDTGIIEAGIEESVCYFHEWWIKRIASINPEAPLTPSHIQAQNGIFFKTTTQLKVSEQGFIYIPKYSRIKIKDLHAVPPGTYKNAKVEFDGAMWDLMLESVVDEEPIQVKFLRDSLDVEVSEDGSVTIEDIVTPSILGFKWFEKSERKIKSLKKKLKRQQPDSNGSLDTINKISRAERKLMNQTTAYYKIISNKVLASKPKELIIKGAQPFNGESKVAHQSRVKVLLQILKGKAYWMGIKVLVKGIKNEMFVVKK